MYVDLLFIVILLGVIFFYKRNFSSIIYGFVIIDLILRIFTCILLTLAPIIKPDFIF